MNKITISNESGYGYTAVPNIFIDSYMKEANDAQLKVYMYLLRKLAGNLPFTISDIADEFNHTEKDICRSLKYWEDKSLLSIKYEHGEIVGIAFTTPSPSISDIKITESEEVDNKPVVMAEILPASFESSLPIVPDKPSYGSDDIKAFKDSEESADLLLIAGQYLKKNLTITDVKSLMYIHNELKFSLDMIDVLLQYCIQKSKREFRYIEKVACGWYEQGICTPEQAADRISVYDNNIYSIMKALGKTGTPTAKEIEFINKWIGTFGLSMEMIFDGCEKACMAVETHRFEYADGIFNNWRNNNLITLEDVDLHESEYRKNRQEKTVQKTTKATNQFNNYKQNQYDYDAILKEIISN